MIAEVREAADGWNRRLGKGETEKMSHVGFTKVQQVECLQLHIITKIVDMEE